MPKTFEFRVTPKDQNWEEWDVDAVKKLFRDWFKRWAFQIECGKNTSMFHIQARLSVKTKNSTVNAVKEILKRIWDEEGTSHYVRPTVEKNLGNMLYVMKTDTRVLGPWTDKDSTGYVQIRFRNPVLRPWQTRLLALIHEQKEARNDRNIIMVYEDTGNVGKSFFKGYAKSKLGAKIIPATMADGNDMVRCLAGQVYEGSHEVHIVLLDVPRATHAKHWFSLARELDTIKQGFLYDERHSWKKVTIEPPVVVCFMNDKPPTGCMSSDVFIYFDINAEPVASRDGTADASPN